MDSGHSVVHKLYPVPGQPYCSAESNSVLDQLLSVCVCFFVRRIVVLYTTDFSSYCVMKCQACLLQKQSPVWKPPGEETRCPGKFSCFFWEVTGKETCTSTIFITNLMPLSTLLGSSNSFESRGKNKWDLYQHFCEKM